MAKFSYEQLEQQSQQQGDKKDYGRVGYFSSLKNDKDEAIVRFAISSTSDLDLVVVHNVQVDGKYRYISCLRNGLEPIDNCPLCANNTPVKFRVFFKMLEYVKDEKGNNVPKAVVWDRPAKNGRENSQILNQIVSFIQEYGDLRNLIFKIKRNGAKGDMQTTYTITLANQNVYPENLYPKDFTAFDNFDLGRHSYYDLNYDEINYFITTGNIPQRVPEETTNNQQLQQQVAPQPQPAQQNVSYQPQAGYTQQPQQTYQQPAPQQTQQATENTGRRIYNY